MSNAPIKVKVGRLDCAVDVADRDSIKVNYDYNTSSFDTSVEATFCKGKVILWSKRDDQSPVITTFDLSTKGIEYDHKEQFSDWLYADGKATSRNKKAVYKNAEELKAAESVRYSALDIALKAMDGLPTKQKEKLSAMQKEILREMDRSLKVSQVQVT